MVASMVWMFVPFAVLALIALLGRMGRARVRRDERRGFEVVPLDRRRE